MISFSRGSSFYLCVDTYINYDHWQSLPFCADVAFSSCLPPQLDAHFGKDSDPRIAQLKRSQSSMSPRAQHSHCNNDISALILAWETWYAYQFGNATTDLPRKPRFARCLIYDTQILIQKLYQRGLYPSCDSSVGVSPDSWVRQWVRVHKARVRVRVRVRVHIRPESESIRCESESIGPESESESTRPESESESSGSESESESASPTEVRVSPDLSPDSAWTHESNNRKVFYFNPNFNHFCWALYW